MVNSESVEKLQINCKQQQHGEFGNKTIVYSSFHKIVIFVAHQQPIQTGCVLCKADLSRFNATIFGNQPRCILSQMRFPNYIQSRHQFCGHSFICSNRWVVYVKHPPDKHQKYVVMTMQRWRKCRQQLCSCILLTMTIKQAISDLKGISVHIIDQNKQK